MGLPYVPGTAVNSPKEFHQSFQAHIGFHSSFQGLGPKNLMNPFGNV